MTQLPELQREAPPSFPGPGGAPILDFSTAPSPWSHTAAETPAVIESHSLTLMGHLLQRPCLPGGPGLLIPEPLLPLFVLGTSFLFYFIFISKLLEVHLPGAAKMLRANVCIAGSLSALCPPGAFTSFFSGLEVSLPFFSPGSSHRTQVWTRHLPNPSVRHSALTEQQQLAPQVW